MEFITDKEINLNLEDSLQTKKYVKTLKNMIESSESKYTIGLFGEWGTGKSSIVKTVQEELEKEKPNDIKFVIYDAWKYSGDSFRRMFIRTLSEQLGFNLKNEIDNFYYDKVEEVENKKFDNKTLYINIGIFTVISIIIFIVLYYLFQDETTSTKDIGLITIIPLVISSIAIFLNNTYKIEKKTIQYNKFFAPEQFENLTNELLSKCIKDYPKLDKIKDFFNGKNGHVKNLKKIVIVIDNIDRCDGETAYQLLTNIKNFLANKEGIVFLIPIDDSALKRHISIENENKSKEADEFLRKFFNVSLKIKYFQPTDLFEFTEHLNQKHRLGLNPSTIDILSKEYATNPRRIIQMLNNLITELDLIQNKMDEEFVQENESLISILLIIREEWIDLYKKIVAEPHSLKDISIKLTDEQNIFFKNTKTVIEKSDILSIEKIVLNIDNYLLISQELIELIKQQNYKELHKSIEDNSNNFENILKYLFGEFSKEIKRATFETSALIIFKNILELNQIQELNEHQLTKFKSIFEENELALVDNIGENEFNVFFKFVNLNHKYELDYLINIVDKKFSDLWGVDDSLEKTFEDEKFVKFNFIWKFGLGDFINNLEDSKFIKNNLSPLLTQHYKFHNSRLDMDYFYYSGDEESEFIKEEKLTSLELDEIIDFIILTFNQ